jgi:hypothetical protein
MNVGDLKRSLEGLPESMDVIVTHGEDALWVCGLGRAEMGRPATFKDNPLSIVKGVPVFEITTRDHA